MAASSPLPSEVSQSTVSLPYAAGTLTVNCIVPASSDAEASEMANAGGSLSATVTLALAGEETS